MECHEYIYTPNIKKYQGENKDFIIMGMLNSIVKNKHKMSSSYSKGDN